MKAPRKRNQRAPAEMGMTDQRESETERRKANRVGMSAGDMREMVEEVRSRIENCYTFERDNRREAEIDLAFVAGDQWPQAVKQARGLTRPMLTINQLPQFVNQVVNPLREADIGIKVRGVDDNTDPTLARIYDELIRQIEYQSNAKQVYVTANEHQVKCGVGWWRVATKYVDDASFDQEIRIQRIRNPLSVYCDPGAIEPSREDAQWIAVVEQWPRSAFKNKWPKANSQDGVSVPASSSPAGFLWASDDYIAVAEYYLKKPVMKTLALLEDGSTIDITDNDRESLAQIEAETPILSTRECMTHEVWKYLVTGTEVLEKPVKWAGKHIPIVCVLGAETPMKHGALRYGIVRFARDPQQLMNFYRTATAEAIALAPKTPWLVTDDMIRNYLGEWNSVNQTNKPFLRYTPHKDFPGLMPKREQPPDVPVALIQEAQFAAEDMKRVTGIFDASLGARSNETSGIAIRNRELQGDTANNHFQDNLMHALVHTGRILIDLIPKIYDNERVIRLTNAQGQEQAVRINRVLYSVDGEAVMENDLSAARFDVRVTVGKSFLTKRAEAVSAMLEFSKALPAEAQMVLLDLIVRNSDWPGAEELAKRLKNLIPPQALADPNDPNAPQPPSPMDDPKFVADLEKQAAQTDEIKARTEKTRMEAQQIDLQTGLELLPDRQLDTLQQQGAQAPEPPKGFAPGSLSLN